MKCKNIKYIIETKYYSHSSDNINGALQKKVSNIEAENYLTI